MLDFHSLQMATASLAEALDVAKVRSDDMFVRDAAKDVGRAPAKR